MNEKVEKIIRCFNTSFKIDFGNTARFFANARGRNINIFLARRILGFAFRYAGVEYNNIKSLGFTSYYSIEKQKNSKYGDKTGVLSYYRKQLYYLDSKNYEESAIPFRINLTPDLFYKLEMCILCRGFSFSESNNLRLFYYKYLGFTNEEIAEILSYTVFTVEWKFYEKLSNPKMLKSLDEMKNIINYERLLNSLDINEL